MIAFAYAVLGPCAAFAQLPAQFPPSQSAQPAQQNPPDATAQNPVNQNPNAQNPDGQQRPLTPEEKRQREIDRYNPLSPQNPAGRVLPGDPKPAAVAPETVTPKPKPEAGAAPLPGSVADSNQPPMPIAGADGPQVVTGDDDANADQRNYNGPAVLSRSYTLSRPMDSKEVKWTWSVGENEIFQTGLVSGAGAGAATNGESFGTSTSFTFTGRHLWKRDQIGVSYTASYNRYFSSYGYNGLNQNLNVDYEHYFTRHLSLNLIESGSILSQNYSLQNPLTTPGVNPANINFATSPTAQVLDQRIRQFNTSAGLTWQTTARLSFNLTEGFFAVDLAGAQFISGTGYQSQADVNYRLTSKSTVGAYYSYTSYLYAQHESSSDSNTVGMIFSHAFNRSTQLRLRGGVSRIESLSYTLVPIDPVFAALVGQQAGVADVYFKTYTSDISAQFIKDFGRRRTANIAFTRGIAPGNGLILTSIQQAMTASFSTSLFRSYILSFTGGRTSLSAEGQTMGGQSLAGSSLGGQNVGTYSSDILGVSCSHAIPRGPAATFAFTYSRFSIAGLPGIQTQMMISSGITWSPGPGRVW
jgi:hypothetical protein